MVKKEKQIVLQKLDGLDAAHNYKYQAPISRDKLRRLLLGDGVVMDVDYMNYLLSLCLEKEAESNKELRINDEEEHDYNFSDHGEEKDEDPGYMCFLEKMKVHDKSYRIEYEEDGSRAIIQYEGASISDTECDQEPRKTLRKQMDGPTNQMPPAEIQGILDSHPTPSREIKMLTCRQMSSKSKSDSEENAKLMTYPTYLHSTVTLKGDLSLDKNHGHRYRRKLKSATKQNDEHFNRIRDDCRANSRPTPTNKVEKRTRTNSPSKSKSEKEEDIVELDPVSHTYSRNPKRSRVKSKSEYDEDIIKHDPDYQIFFQSLKLFNDDIILIVGDNKIVYDLKSGQHIQVKEEENDDESSDVEIIDSTTFYKMTKGSDSNHWDTTGQSEFRDKVIAALRKPFDEEEYKKLWQDIKLQKPKERHIDLRCGRERPIGTQENGKSYLDYHPALKRKLLQAQGNRPKCLNLLRGFFLWIRQSGAFQPWLDNECLAVCPAKTISESRLCEMW